MRGICSSLRQIVKDMDYLLPQMREDFVLYGNTRGFCFGSCSFYGWPLLASGTPGIMHLVLSVLNSYVECRAHVSK